MVSEQVYRVVIDSGQYAEILQAVSNVAFAVARVEVALFAVCVVVFFLVRGWVR